MKTPIILFCCLLIFPLFFSCKDDDNVVLQDFEKKVLLTVDASILPPEFPQQWIFISDLEGEIIGFNEVIAGDIIDIENTAPFAGSTFYVNIALHTGNYLNITTYTGVESSTWNYNNHITNLPGTDGLPVKYTSSGNSLSSEVEFLTVSNHRRGIEHGHALQYFGSTHVDTIDKKLLVTAKLKNEDFCRLKQFENLNAGDSIHINIEELPQRPFQYFAFPENDYSLIYSLGINSCYENYKGYDIRKFPSFGDSASLTHIPIVFPTDIFDLFGVHAFFEKGNNSYRMFHYGDPIYEYAPTPPAIVFNDDNLNQFEINPIVTNTYHQIYWAHQYNISNEEKTIRWFVFGDFKNGQRVKTPKIPDQIKSVANWADKSDLQLSNVTEYASDFVTYKKYLENNFYSKHDVYGFPSGCDAYGFNAPYEIKTLNY